MKYRTSFMGIAGIKTIALDVKAEVPRPFQHKIEMALVLDYSYSMMTSDKYKRVRDAASRLIDNLEASAPPGSVKVGLVPFSAVVRTTLPASYVSQPAMGATWTVAPRIASTPTTPSTTNANAATQYGYIDGGFENQPPYDCSVYGTRNLDIVPLTTDLTAMKAKLAAMMPVGNTNIPLGAAFGWHLLDPDPPFAEATPYTDDMTAKYLILLTDGVQTSSQWGSDGLRSVAHGNENLLALCQGMKGKDITVFAIAYDITDSKTTGLLHQCAPANYSEPDKSSAELDAAFQDIAGKIRTAALRLSQ
jgi:hypothetical protein